MLTVNILFLLLVLPLVTGQDYHVKDFNATGDGVTDDTNAVRAALLAAANTNGGRVIFDDGYKFLTGSFNVTSNVILDVRGVILASQVPDEFHYPLIPPLPWYGGGTDFQESGAPDRNSVIQSYNATNITLTGGGVVDGQGYPWWACSWSTSDLEKPPCNNISRPNFVRFIRSSNIYVNNIIIKDCTAWCLHLAWVTTSHIHDIKITTPGLHIAHNTDGIDIDCSVDVLVENVYYQGSDDAIAVKSGKDYNGRTFGRTSENILVRNVTIFNSSNTGLSIGSEMSGGVRNVTFTEIFSNHCANAAVIKIARGRGGIVEDITYNNFQVYNSAGIAAFVQFHSSSTPTNETGTPKVKNIRLTNLYFDGPTRGWHLNGLPESPYRDVYIYNVTVKNYKNLWDSCQAVDGFCDNSSVSPECPPCLNQGCPLDWSESSTVKNRCYRVYNTTLSGTDAQYACQNFTLTSLVSIVNAFENSDVTTYIKKSCFTCQKVYIGLQRNNNVWSWINGDNSTYRNWETGYPLNDPSTNCVVLNVNDGKWTNQACSNTQNYICGFSLYEI